MVWRLTNKYNGSYTMTLAGQLMRIGAVCSATVDEQNMFTMKEDDLKSSSAEVGDSVRVVVFKRGSEDSIKALDRQTFTTSVLPNGQIMIPNDAANNLDLEAEDSISYVVAPKDKFPSISDGPVRSKVRGDNNDAQDVERGEREDTEATFQGPKMRQTGQIRVPGEVQDRLALIQGDSVSAKVEYEGEMSDVFETTFGTGDRITINTETREMLGLDSGDKPTVSISVQ